MSVDQFKSLLTEWKLHLRSADNYVMRESYERHVEVVKSHPLFATWRATLELKKARIADIELELAMLQRQQASLVIPGVDPMDYNNRLRAKQNVDDVEKTVRKHVAAKAYEKAFMMTENRRPRPEPATFLTKFHKQSYAAEVEAYETDLKKTTERLTNEMVQTVLSQLFQFGDRRNHIAELEQELQGCRREALFMEGLVEPFSQWCHKNAESERRMFVYDIWTRGFVDAWYPTKEAFLADREQYRALVRAEAVANRENVGIDVEAYIDSFDGLD